MQQTRQKCQSDFKTLLVNAMKDVHAIKDLLDEKVGVQQLQDISGAVLQLREGAEQHKLAQAALEQRLLQDLEEVRQGKERKAGVEQLME